jgi:hypothetical protein
VACVAAAAVAFAAGAESAALSAPTRAQLELMPLPRVAYGSILAGVKRAPSARWVPNEDASQGAIDPRLSAAQLKRLGRLTGYGVRFEGSGEPLINALTEADLFRTDDGAARFVTLQAETYARMEGKSVRVHKVVFDHVSHFRVAKLATARGVRARMDLGGGYKVTLTMAPLRVGSVVGVVGLLRTDERDVRADVVRLAQALDRRIRDVLAGRIR